MFAAARSSLRASTTGSSRSQIGNAAATAATRSVRLPLGSLRPLSTRSAATGKSNNMALLAGVAAAGTALAMLVQTREPLHMEGERRKSYAERSKPREQRANVAGGSSDEGKVTKKETSKEGGSEQKSDSATSSDSKADNGKAENEQKQEGKTDSVAETNTLDLNEMENEASQESAFDPETNTINWDCPCLGGMAHGPCGEEFKEAFSCFVFSEGEPKGIECVEKFKGMQECFRKYPDHYREELEDDEEYEKRGQDSVEGKEEQSTSPSAPSGGEEDEDEGIKEWRSELAKEGKN